MSGMMYGCEIMSISDKQIEMFGTAHRFVARRIQHLSEKSPSVICLASLGWWTLESYIDKRKLMYLRKLLDHQTPDLYRTMVIHKWWEIYHHVGKIPFPVCQRHGLLHVDEVITWLCPTRTEWNTLVNNVISYREFCRWRSLCLMYKRLDMFLSVVPKPQLCIWPVVGGSKKY